jgi:two-component system response regulator PilR (NtrC family)
MRDAETPTPKALIVDDEPGIRELLEMTLARMQVECVTAADLAQAKQQLARENFDLCLTDMRLPDGNGIDLVRHIQQRYPDIPAAVITAHGNMESAVEALKAGAFDFVSKPVELQVLRNLVTTALKLSKQTQVPTPQPGLSLIGDSPLMNQTRATIEKVARSQAPVYVSGESGTGKELVARLIHARGPRRDQPFVPVNCGAIPAELMESEFFGHKKGSFTGAVVDKEGLFQAADGSTLFLDEVADLPLSMQVKLLRAIQEKAVRPIGANKEIPVDVRILSATHKDLAALVRDGKFRQDLYYRINVIELHVPSLRERPEDIPALIEHCLRRIAGEWGAEVPRVDPSAVSALRAYPFPGNVRELENILERAMTLCEGDSISRDDLQLPQHGEDAQGQREDAVNLDPYLDNKEREVITRALEQTRYNRTAAAKLLGITFRQLRYRMKKLNID